MQSSQIPAKMPVVWGASAGPSYIRTVPVASQIGVQNGAASFTDGFPPDTFVPAGGGGVPPFGQDANGIFNEVTSWLQWVQATSAAIPYDSTFQAAVGGYPKGAVVASVANFGVYWLSTAENNTTNPDTGGAGWVVWAPGGSSYLTDTGAANVMVATPTPALGAYPVGTPFLLNPAHANTGATTLNISGLGAKNVVHVDGTALITGEIAAGNLMLVVYTGTVFQWLNPLYAPTQGANDHTTKPASTAYADRAATNAANAIDVFAGNLVGLISTNTPAHTTTQETISVGSCRDHTNSVPMVLLAPMAKDITALWSAGTGNGGRLVSTAIAAGQTWFKHLIYNPTSGAVDWGYDTSPTAPTLPSGYTYSRRIGCTLFDPATTNIKQYLQVGTFTEYVTRSADYAAQTNGGGVPHLRPVTVPNGVKTKAKMYFQSTGTASTTNFLSGIYDPDLGTPGAFGGTTQWAQIRRGAVYSQAVGSDLSYGTTMVEQYTDASANVYTFSSDNAADVIALGVIGYEDITLNRFY